MEHPQTFLRQQHSQFPSLRTNRNSEHRSRLDHPEIRGVYKPVQHSIRQETLTSIYQDSFSGSGLSSPALQRPHRDSFSESPSGQLNEKSLTDSREERIARGKRPGIVYPLPRAARSCCPTPHGMASYRVGYPGAKTAGGNSLSRTFSTAWITLAQVPIPQAAQESLLWSVQAKEVLSTPRPLV